ncbi:MAG: FG-GAP-like repeat-containing protein [bacterium]|nr:FG-GAP-like repeat-containing protein [bacterium]
MNWKFAPILLFGLLLVFPVTAATINISGDGCFVREQDEVNSEYTIRMQATTCILTLNNTEVTSKQVTVLIENIDPDFVTVNKYDTDDGLVKTDNTLQFIYTLSTGTEEIEITPWHEYDEEYYFVAMSDNQALGTIDVNPVFEQILRQVNVVNPVFFTNSGDLVHGSSTESTMREMYDAVFFALEAVDSPMYPIAGNHDFGPGLDVFADYFGVDDYSFDFANTHFAGLSTSGSTAKGEVTADQLAWLETDLSVTSKTHSIAFFHHPIAVPTWANVSSFYLTEDERLQLAETVDNAGVHTSIVGHAHGYDYRLLSASDASTITNGFYQLITGGAGGSLAQPDGAYHFILMHVTADDVVPLVIDKNDFDTIVEYDNNDGTSEIATAEVTNDASEDLPYLRLKFKLNSDYDSYVLYDEDGVFYDDFYFHTFDDYTALYFETNALANSNHTYTVAPATNVHEDRINTVSSSGQVSYDIYPETSNTAVVGFVADPKKRTTQVTNIDWGSAGENYSRSWTETPELKKISTTYTVGDLPSRRLFEINVNGKYFTRAGTNSTGSLNFVYTPNVVSRDISMTMLDNKLAEDVVIAPYNSGSPHVRIFDPAGKTLTSWMGISKNNNGAHNIIQANIKGNDEREVVLSSGLDSGGSMEVYYRDGDHIASKKPYGSTYNAGVLVKSGDLNGNGYDELVTVPEQGNALLKIYRYNKKKGNLRKIAAKKVFGDNFLGDVSIEISDLDADGKAEILVTDSTANTPLLKVYKLRKGKIRLVARTNIPTEYGDAVIAAGDFKANGNKLIALFLQATNDKPDRLQIYKLTDKNTLHLVTKRQLETGLTGNVKMIAGDVDKSGRDALIMTADNATYFQGYRVTKKNKANRLFNKYPFGESYSGGINIGLVDSQSDWDAEIVTTQLAEPTRIKVWNYHKKTSELRELSSWLAYDNIFSGGANLAN